MFLPFHFLMDMALTSTYSEAMDYWCSQIDISHPVWSDYRDRLFKLGELSFPGPRELNLLLPDGLSSKGRNPIRFVASRDLPGVDYEKHIFSTGEVSTREENWHDLFNALVWSRFPCLKVALNAVHFRERESAAEGSRGKQRDALTLFDECGIIVCSSQKWLDAIAGHDWHSVFQAGASAWVDEIRLYVVGHTLLEKFLQPYKAITANALLLRPSDSFFRKPRDSQLPMIDDWVAERLLAGAILDSPACLSPLPLMGLPGWWPKGMQDGDFYSDQNVFRPMREAGRKAPVFDCGRSPCGR